MNHFEIDIGEEEIRREKDRARELRRSRWWQNRIAKGLCHYCGGCFSRRPYHGPYRTGHQGGEEFRGNVVPACKECNSKKKYFLPMEWDEYLASEKSEK